MSSNDDQDRRQDGLEGECQTQEGRCRSPPSTHSEEKNRVVDGLLLAAAVTMPLMTQRLANAIAQRRVALSAQLQPRGLGERDPV